MGVFGAVIVISCASFLIGIVIGYNKGFKECTESFKKAGKNIWNSAIDDFLEEMEKWNSQIKFMRNENAFFTIENIREVAEQLKR